MKTIETDCLIIGSGIAGCAAALTAADTGLSVLMITRTKRPEETASSWAQGGIVYRSENENPETDLVDDILKAGAGICYQPAVEQLARLGPELVQKFLIDRLKISFDRGDDDEFALGEEAVHSHARILHVGDHTGREIQKGFLQEVDRCRERIRIWTEATAIDLLTLAHHSVDPQDFYEPPRCIGAYVLDQSNGEVTAVLAKEIILGTGGLGQLYLHTTNPEGARGDGLAMAYRTGARIMNLEYVQFHPTALYRKGGGRFLITEAMRGEGGRLINDEGKPFMERYDSRAELAPRDVVSRAIHDEMLRTGASCVYLDISHKSSDWIRNRFPRIYSQCLSVGVDMTKDPIPVVPAAHYSCGGVAVDLKGNTTIRNLLAVGEVACTGVHGANRLASTSLLENLVWGVAAGNEAARRVRSRKYRFPKIHEWVGEAEPIDHDLVTQDWLTIKHTMWNYVGLVRTPRRLERAQRILRELSEETAQFYSHSALSDELIGLRNGICSAMLILTAARRNRHNTGCHYIRHDSQE